jgi:hypothetical protein
MDNVTMMSITLNTTNVLRLAALTTAIESGDGKDPVRCS